MITVSSPAANILDVLVFMEHTELLKQA